jgi:imidazole glycerol-phosphate synthase
VIGLLDYGCGNLGSLENALAFLGLPCRRVAEPAGLAAVDRLILPGVGHFGHAMARLGTSGLEGPLRAWAGGGRPLLGICLGMQLLFEGSEEAPGLAGLGLLPGRFTAFTDPALKVPHMGWSPVAFGGGSPSPLDGTAYFVHSYRLPAWVGPPPERLGLARYGGPFVAAFQAGNLAGCQFHPEKSGDWGLACLGEALAWS